MNLQRLSYKVESENLAKAIDIAIEAIENYCPKGYEPQHQKRFISVYNDIKQKVLNPEPQFKNLTSLKYSTQNIFIFFQEASGEAVEYFWSKIKERGLKYERENKLKKILKRGKIKGQIEYDYVTDMIVAAQQTGLINEEEVNNLKNIIGEFELKNKK